MNGSSFEQTWIPIIQGCFVPILLKLAQCFLEEDVSISSMYFRYFIIISPWKNLAPFIWTNLNPIHPWMCCAKFGWNWPSGSAVAQWFSRRGFFLISSMYFRYFVIISPWKRATPFNWTNLNPVYQRMLCAKFGWNWSSVLEEKIFKFCQCIFVIS